MSAIIQIHFILLALLATLFTWLVTALGASTVFFCKKAPADTLKYFLSASAGVMIAASVWSLILPALDYAQQQDLSYPQWIPVVIGFFMGGGIIALTDRFIDSLSRKGVKKRPLLLFISITLHNLPEGFAVGCAFGAAAITQAPADYTAALILALGIGIQNFPEGAAVSLPLKNEGASPLKAFFIGQLSAVVEPLGGVLGAWAVSYVVKIMPLSLSLAAGAMIYVAAKELIPESMSGRRPTLSCLFLLFGFALMMVLDVALK
ncbi:MAG: ZIP family metal transporter [Clostridiales bacterium]|nr:ZIP family metal transporter [Clostridiales bacterium]